MRNGPAPDMQSSGIRQVHSLPGRDDAPKPDFTGMARYHFAADVAPRCRLHAVSTYDDVRDDVIAVPEVQAHASGLVGQAHQPVTEADVFRWHRSGEKTGADRHFAERTGYPSPRSSLSLQEFDVVFGEPGEQVTAARPDEVAAGEPGVIGNLSDRSLGQEEGFCCLVCGELGFGLPAVRPAERWRAR